MLSRYHGVHYNNHFYNDVTKEQKPWFFQITYKGQKFHRHFKDERDAAIAYDKKVLELGLNKPLNILKPIQ